tara:strand:- start:189 stop:563 length:375 start_codon:yes stop_codon:yes gene_type:complete
MTSPIFSQKDTETDLVCLPTQQAKQIVVDLTSYDFCKQERDSLKVEIIDLNQIINQNSILLREYKVVSDSLFIANKNCYNQKINLELNLQNKEDKIKSLRNTKTLTILTTIIGTLTPILLNNNN